jgi:hypothetical protein
MKREQTERRELWRQRIAQQEQSGRSLGAFCQSESIAPHELPPGVADLSTSEPSAIRGKIDPDFFAKCASRSPAA